MRRPDGTASHELEPGDYAKRTIKIGGEPTEVWFVCTPNGLTGRLSTPRDFSEHHQVEEHQDGTISVMPHPGNSNSILVSDSSSSWHGYINRGVFKEIG